MDISDKNRVEKYKKDNLVETVLEEMNKTLFPKELELIKGFTRPELPVIFIVGAQRSGTTILMQLITQLFDVAYPNNFIARYWNVPYTGAILFKSLENNLTEDNPDFSSDLGYTKGLKGPHEFGYFWKKWFPWDSWEEKRYDEIDYTILQKQLAAWQSINNTPLVFKNIIQVSFNIEKLADLFPNALFIHIKRKPEFVVQSTYLSRLKLYGDASKWIGLQPPEYNEIIKRKDIFEQITLQVYYSRKHIEDTLNDNINFITLNYEDIVSDLQHILDQIKNRVKLKEISGHLPVLRNTNDIKLSEEEFGKIEYFCKKYFK